MFESDLQIVERLASWANQHSGHEHLVVAGPRALPQILVNQGEHVRGVLRCGPKGQVAFTVTVWLNGEVLNTIFDDRIAKRGAHPEAVFDAAMGFAEQASNYAAVAYEHGETSWRSAEMIISFAIELARSYGNWLKVGEFVILWLDVAIAELNRAESRDRAIALADQCAQVADVVKVMTLHPEHRARIEERAFFADAIGTALRARAS